MARVPALLNQVIHHLTVLSYDSEAGKYLCRCVCGKEKAIHGTSLHAAKKGGRGGSKSCGCMRSKRLSEIQTTHGQSGTQVYKVWSEMVRKHLYGKDGIPVCCRWLGRSGFQNFLSDMGPRPQNGRITRKNLNSGYEPSNCFWDVDLPYTLVTVRGETMTMREWACKAGITVKIVGDRIRAGWSVEDAVTVSRVRGLQTVQEKRMKATARKRVRYAVSKGHLVKPGVCEYPGCASPPVDSHHNDYSQPLSVLWYCHEHHKAADRETMLTTARVS